MEAKTQKPKWHNLTISGKWRIHYKVRNSIGPEAFGGYHLPNYLSPFDQTDVRLRDVNYATLKGYMLTAIVKDLFPDKDPNVKLLINWMICHPEVLLKGVPDLDEEILKSKITSSQITLECLDYVEITKLDEEDYIDKIVGQLSMDSGVKAVGIERLRHILAQLDLPYSIPRFEPEVEKKALRSKLKSFVRSSMDNAKSVSTILDNMDNAKDIFLFKEMVRLRLIDFSNGLYKFNNVPLGESYDRVRIFFENHPEVKSTLLNKLAKLTGD